MSTESEFVKVMMDGSFQEAAGETVASFRKLAEAIAGLGSSAHEVIAGIRAERAESARRVHEWKGDWLWL